MPFQTLHRLIRDQRGATAIEYGLIAMSVAVALAATFLSLGNSVDAHYQAVEDGYREAQ